MTFRKLQLVLACAVISLTACETNPKRIQYATATKYAKVEVPHIFSDHMVLQQGMSVPVWGWGPEGEVVTVTFRNETVRARVKKGQWMVKLWNLTPGAPDTLTITAGNGQSMQFTNVVV